MDISKTTDKPGDVTGPPDQDDLGEVTDSPDGPDQSSADLSDSDAAITINSMTQQAHGDVSDSDAAITINSMTQQAHADVSDNDAAITINSMTQQAHADGELRREEERLISDDDWVDPLPSTLNFIPTFQDKESITLESFSNYMLNGETSLSSGELGVAETYFVSALRLVYRWHGNEKQVKRCLLGLGGIYSSNGEKHGRIEDVINAVGVYNGALRRSSNEEERRDIIGSLEFLDRLALGILRDRKDEDRLEETGYAVDVKNKNHLTELRAKYAKAISEIDSLEDDIQPSEGDTDARAEKESNFVAAVEELYAVINNDMKDFLKRIVEEAIHKIGGPPCAYAVMGLGSLARQEMTPYSDYEFAILIEEDTDENRKYFRNLTLYMHIRVMNLGETLIPSLGIKSLNDTYSGSKESDWFWEDAPRGVSYDGAMAWASHIPTGRKPTKDKDWVTELIGNPQDLARFQEHETMMKEGYHTAEVLRNVTFVVGEPSLVKEYLDAIRAIHGESSEGSEGTNLSDLQRETKKMLAKDMNQYAPVVGVQNVGTLWKVKKDMYRLTNVFFSAAAALYGIYADCAASSWEIIRQLTSKGVLNERAAHNLSLIHSISTWLRLKTYMNNKAQKENMTVLQVARESKTDETLPKESVQEVFHVVNRGLIFRFMQTGSPLENAATKLASAEGIPESIVPETDALCDYSLFNRALTCMRLMDNQQAEVLFKQCLKERETNDNVPVYIVYWRLAFMSARLSKLDESHEFHKKALDECRKAFPDEPNHPDLVGALDMLSLEARNAGRFEEALGYIKESQTLISTWSPEERVKYSTNITANQINFATVLNSMGKMRESVEILESVLEASQSGEGKSERNYDMANLLGNIGTGYLELGNFEKAKEYLLASLNMKVEVYGVGVAHPEVADTLNNIGILYCMIHETEDAVVIMEEGVDMNIQLYGDNSSQPSAVAFLYNLANAYYQLGMITMALHSYQDLLERRRALRGENAKHPSIAGNLNNIGACHSKMGDYPMAIIYYKMALEMRSQIYGENMDHFEIADSHFNLGCVYLDSDSFHEAQARFNTALSMFKKVFGEDSTHPYILETHENLRRIYEELGMNDQAKIHSDILSSILSGNQGVETQDVGVDGEDDEMQRAIAMSLALEVETQTVDIDDEDAEMARAIAMSLGHL